MIKIADKRDCCGCEGCAQACPKQCIAMKEDGEGFRYPSVDPTACVECGLCERVCPMLNPPQAREPLTVSAGKNRNAEVRRRSASGGLFAPLAAKVISRGGAAFGAVMDSDCRGAHHACAMSMDDAAALMGSKYLQSRSEGCFAHAKRLLDEGREVIYCGTGCQIAALRRYLQRDYERLLAIDFVCHGVPSGLAWRRHLDEIESAHRSAARNVLFRDKSSGWKTFSLTLELEDGQKVSRRFTDDSFMQLYLNDMLLRPSCFRCPSRGHNRASDITLGDFWGIELCLPKMDDPTGVGLAIANSERGRKALEEIDIITVESNIKDATYANPSYYAAKPAPRRRKQIFEELSANAADMDHLAENYLKKTLLRQAAEYLRDKCKAAKRKAMKRINKTMRQNRNDINH